VWHKHARFAQQRLKFLSGIPSPYFFFIHRKFFFAFGT